MNVVVTGGTGLLGKSLYHIEDNYTYLSSGDVNLMDSVATKCILSKLKPTIVIHLAGKVGGIRDNIENPYQFILQNNLINTNIIDWCVKSNVRLIFASSTCVYPKTSIQYPMTENMVDLGEPESTNNAYAYAKRFAGQMLRTANKQYGFKYCTLYFCNLYGEYDNFLNETKSHLVTALIQKFHNAKEYNKDRVVLFGTGNPMRQFIYSTDAANIIKIILDKNINGEYNVAIPENLTIRTIAQIAKEIVGFKGNIEFNSTLDGVYRKDVCSQKLLNTIGKYEFTPLRLGIEKTYNAFLRKTKLCGS